MLGLLRGTAAAESAAPRKRPGRLAQRSPRAVRPLAAGAPAGVLWHPRGSAEVQAVQRLAKAQQSAVVHWFAGRWQVVFRVQPNPSFERTFNIRLRLLLNAAQLKR